jgi:hypothetical protein
LEVGVICLSTIPYSSLVVMVLNKECTGYMCLNLRDFSNMMIKNKFPILVIYDLLDEIYASKFFTKLDLSSFDARKHLGIHQ